MSPQEMVDLVVGLIESHLETTGQKNQENRIPKWMLEYLVPRPCQGGLDAEEAFLHDQDERERMISLLSSNGLEARVPKFDLFGDTIGIWGRKGHKDEVFCSLEIVPSGPVIARAFYTRDYRFGEYP